ncbi:hypothetical protein HWV62_13124 [Athelia sp. TMB]|nr:hypothetical protein HWV62_13124 [Athelia sp. TMB]
MPSCTDEFYPDDSWATKNFVLATRTEKDFHMHPISDFSPWIPRAVAGAISYETGGNHDKESRVLVEERQDDVGGARTSWEIVAATSFMHQSDARAPIRKVPFNPTAMISSPTSTSCDFTESDTSGEPSPRCLSEISDAGPPPPSAKRSRHYIAGTLTVFKVRLTRSMSSRNLTGLAQAEDHMFRINRALLDDEGAAIPAGVGSEDDPIELTNVRAADLEVMLDFLSLGTRHDKKPLTLLDWASVMVIRVKFLSDPSLPSCTDDLYPNDSWATKNFILATRPEKDYHAHPISDFSPWIPAAMVGSIPYVTGENHSKDCRVLVEERQDDVGGERTSWEIVAATRA